MSVALPLNVVEYWIAVLEFELLLVLLVLVSVPVIAFAPVLVFALTVALVVALVLVLVLVLALVLAALSNILLPVAILNANTWLVPEGLHTSPLGRFEAKAMRPLFAVGCKITRSEAPPVPPVRSKYQPIGLDGIDPIPVSKSVFSTRFDLLIGNATPEGKLLAV